MSFGRALLFILKIGILVALAVWLANRPGEFSLTWLGYRIDMPIGVALAGAILSLLLLIGIGRLAAFFMAVPGEIGLMHRNRRQAKGYVALTRGLAAAAGGDAKEARRLAHQATKLLGGVPITRLLEAQTAQLAGDEGEAKALFAALAEEPETAILGLRGLASAALKRGDEAEALILAERALGANANAQWAAETAMRLQAKQGRMDASAGSLNALVRAGGLSAKEGQRRRAALLTEKARQALIPIAQRSEPEAPSLEAALAAAREAVKLAADLVPARFVLSRLLIRQGRAKEAMRLIEQGWDDHPHPLLAALFQEADGNERPLDRQRRLERLLRQNPDHAESHRVLANASLTAELWGEARRHLERLIDLERQSDGETSGGVTQGTCRLMARLAEAERGDVMEARRWLDEAAGARPDPAWVCAQCGTRAEAGPESGQWQLCCPQCGALDNLRWRSPPGASQVGSAHPSGEFAGAISRLPEGPRILDQTGSTPAPQATPPAETGASVDAARLIN